MYIADDEKVDPFVDVGFENSPGTKTMRDLRPPYSWSPFNLDRTARVLIDVAPGTMSQKTSTVTEASKNKCAQKPNSHEFELRASSPPIMDTTPQNTDNPVGGYDSPFPLRPKRKYQSKLDVLMFECKQFCRRSISPNKTRSGKRYK